jgi:hypothetical protein
MALRPGATGRVLASFSRLCDLVTDKGDVVVLAWGGTEQGPLTVLLEPDPEGDLRPGLTTGDAFQVGVGELWLTRNSLPAVRVDLSGAAPWDARLHWEALQPRHEQIRTSSRIVSRVVTQARSAGSGPRWQGCLNQATEAVLRAQPLGDRGALRAAAQELCGLGEGLTPQGDDWLAGWLLGLRLAGPVNASDRTPGPLGEMVLEVAIGRTTVLSQAFLACAAAGEAAESWHMLLSQMARDRADERAVEGATHTILAHGATSGAAMLEGFLAGLGPDRGS